jgi:predicted nucleic acid-binding protein
VTILADTSAWIEFLRRTESPVAIAMGRHLDADQVATTDLVIMEVLAGTADAGKLAKVQRALNACTYFPQRRLFDAQLAASLYRDCRRAGETPRQLTDCLIAVIAMRHRVAVLERDRDFQVLARHSDLQVVAG